MCLIAFAIGQNPRFPLVVAANRDEFFRRPTAAMDWWQADNGQHILAGRDLASGGTWLAISADGQVAAVTNVREGSPETGRSSRGELPVRALAEPASELGAALNGETFLHQRVGRRFQFALQLCHHLLARQARRNGRQDLIDDFSGPPQEAPARPAEACIGRDRHDWRLDGLRQG